jgi:hypothetical protein
MNMKRKFTDNSSANPSVVLRAFAPETHFTLTLDGWILLEALESPFVTGQSPGLRDLVIAVLVMTDTAAVADARKNRGFDKLVADATFGKSPGDVMSLVPRITAAIQAAFDPADTGTQTEKKTLRDRLVARPD